MPQDVALRASRELESLKTSMVQNGPVLQRYFTELSDLRKFIFQDPSISSAYRHTLMGVLQPVIDFDPANREDSLVERIGTMTRALHDSELPPQLKTRLLAESGAMSEQARANLSAIEGAYKGLSGVVGDLLPSVALGKQFSREALMAGFPGLDTEQVKSALQRRLSTLAQDLRAAGAPPELLAKVARFRADTEHTFQSLYSSSFLDEITRLRADILSDPHLVGVLQGRYADFVNLTDGKVSERLRDDLESRLKAVREEVLRRIQDPAKRQEVLGHLDPYLKEVDEILNNQVEAMGNFSSLLAGLRERLRNDVALRSTLGEDVLGNLNSVLDHPWNDTLKQLGGKVSDLVISDEWQNVSLPDSVKLRAANAAESFFQQHGVSEIDRIGDTVAASHEFSKAPDDVRALLEIILSVYFKGTDLKYKKQMLMGILNAPPEKGFLGQLNGVLQNAGPGIQKIPAAPGPGSAVRRCDPERGP